MSGDELARYSRQIVLPQIGVHGQQILCDSTALVIGLGGLGSIAAMYLAGAGVGRLLLSDRDRVDASNLHRQLLYRQADLGRAKTEAARDSLGAMNPTTECLALEGRLTAERLASMVSDADVVLDCTDNFPTRFAVNEACVRARKPLVSGAAIRFEGQILVFDARRADSACYACVYPERGDTQERCEDAGILGPVAGVIGSLQALAALRLLLGQEQDVNRLQVWDASGMTWRSVSLARDPHCAACGKPA